MPDLTDTLRADRRHKMLTSFAAGQPDLSAVRLITIGGLRARRLVPWINRPETPEGASHIRQ